MTKTRNLSKTRDRLHEATRQERLTLPTIDIGRSALDEFVQIE